jgi:anti-anti-sigma factor
MSNVMQVLRPRGEISLAVARQLETLLSEYMKAGLVQVVLNLENVNHISQDAIPLLARRAGLLRECGGDLKLAGLSPYLQKLWDLAGHARHFQFCVSEEEAGRKFAALAA